MSPAFATLVESVATTTISVVPSNATPLIFLGVASLVAVVAFPETLPVRLAVIVPALKFPLESLATTLLAVFADVASTLTVTPTDPSKLLTSPPNAVFTNFM